MNSIVLSKDQIEDLENNLFKIFNNFRFFDFRLYPVLLKSESSEENAFEWKFKWECKVGSGFNKVLKKEDLDHEAIMFIDDFSKKIGWQFTQAMKTKTKLTWEGMSFNLTSYGGHPSWKFVKHPFKNFTSFSPTFSDKSKRRIIGVIQVKDSDLLIGDVIKRTLDMVDSMIILDNNSSDDTISIIKDLQEKTDKIILKNILTVHSGGRFLNTMCGTDTVVVRIDADEIWRRESALRLRENLLNINFSNFYKVYIKNGSFNVDGIDIGNGVCSGKHSKLAGIYYFGNILAWNQMSERLHGECKTLRDGVGEMPQAIENLSIDEKPMVLHFPFLCLSSMGRDTFKPGWEENKSRYVCAPENQSVISFKEYKISDSLKKIMETNALEAPRSV